MRVLGLDPGSRHTGWGLIESHGSRIRGLEWGRISPTAGLGLAERLHLVASEVETLVRAHRPDVAAVERVFHGVNARSLIVLAEARGALLAALARAGLGYVEVSPTQVKSSVAGSGRADKRQVARMVGLQLGLAAHDLAADTTDALAIAITGAQLAGRADAIRQPG